MTPRGGGTARERPADRKQQIERAAGMAFARDGYDGTSMQDIAGAVGITPAALYRHFPNKYALYAGVSVNLTRRLESATSGFVLPANATAAEAEAILRQLFEALIEVVVDTRDYGGIYRWEGRHFTPEHDQDVRGILTTLLARIAHLVRATRPDLPDNEATRLALATLSLIASITAHRTAPPRERLDTLLCDAALRVVHTTSSGEAMAARVDTQIVVEADDDSRAGRLVTAAAELFATSGFAAVSIEEIAQHAGLPISAVYRLFDGKAALLRAVFDRAAAALEVATRHARDEATSAADALQTLSVVYARHSVVHRGLMRVFASEIPYLDEDDRRLVRRLQRDHVARWVAVALENSPAIDTVDATVLGYAALNVAADQVARWDADDETQIATIAATMLSIIRI